MVLLQPDGTHAQRAPACGRGNGEQVCEQAIGLCNQLPPRDYNRGLVQQANFRDQLVKKGHF